MSARLRHRTWYVVALSAEIDDGRVFGGDFFDGRVAVYRDSAGAPVVLDARCPHMGADLSLGDVCGDNLRCMFHHFEYAPSGRCVRIPSNDALPRAARVASYPAVERWGMVWAFNGDSPDVDAPGIRGFDDADLVVRARRTDLFEVEPWVILGNSFDFQHLRYVHALRFDDPADIAWHSDGRVEYDVTFDSDLIGTFTQQIRVSGTNTVSYVTSGSVASMGLFTSTPVVGGSQSYYLAATPREGTPDEIAARLALQELIADELLKDDTRAFRGMKFVEGAFVGADRHLRRWFTHARDFAQV